MITYISFNKEIQNVYMNIYASEDINKNLSTFHQGRYIIQFNFNCKKEFTEKLKQSLQDLKIPKTKESTALVSKSESLVDTIMSNKDMTSLNVKFDNTEITPTRNISEIFKNYAKDFKLSSILTNITCFVMDKKVSDEEKAEFIKLVKRDLDSIDKVLDCVYGYIRVDLYTGIIYISDEKVARSILFKLSDEYSVKQHVSTETLRIIIQQIREFIQLIEKQRGC